MRLRTPSLDSRDGIGSVDWPANPTRSESGSKVQGRTKQVSDRRENRSTHPRAGLGRIVGWSGVDRSIGSGCRGNATDPDRGSIGHPNRARGVRCGSLTSAPCQKLTTQRGRPPPSTGHNITRPLEHTHGSGAPLDTTTLSHIRWLLESHTRTLRRRHSHMRR